MSRYEIYHDDKTLAFGNDHACGEYLQIWKRPADKKERRQQDTYGPDDKDMLVDKDRFTGFTKEKMLKLIEEHGFKRSELENVKRGELF